MCHVYHTSVAFGRVLRLHFRMFAIESKLPTRQVKSGPLDLTPYAGRWVALIGGRVAGVGRTAAEARTAAKLARPKEEPALRFVPARRRRRTEKDVDSDRC
jgi:hypothetical protein